MRLLRPIILFAFAGLTVAAIAAEVEPDATRAAEAPAAATVKTPVTPALIPGPGAAPVTPPAATVFDPDAPKIIIERGPCPAGGDCVRHCTNCHHGRPADLPFPRDRL